MAEHRCEIYEIVVASHPNADALELGKIGDFNVVVGLGQFVSGQRVIYLPSASIVPDELISEMNLTGKLAGQLHNRIKPIRLRGVMSEGLVLADKFPELPLGSDVAELLGVTKYVPRIPAQFSGEMGACVDFAYKFDIENIKKYPDVFNEGEPVFFTEKLHGTFMGICIPPFSARITENILFSGPGEPITDENPTVMDMHRGLPPSPYKLMVSSKGLLGQGLFFADTEKNRASNIYVRTLFKDNLINKILAIPQDLEMPEATIWIFGEIFGLGVQSGFNYGQTQADFRVFALKIGNIWIDQDRLEGLLNVYGITKVPTLYSGPFSKEVLLQYTTGMETVSGKNTHIREGVCITANPERYSPEIGRCILKSINEKYLEKETGEECQ